jgi:hypothetical protein
MEGERTSQWSRQVREARARRAGRSTACVKDVAAGRSAYPIGILSGSNGVALLSRMLYAEACSLGALQL